MRRLLVLLVLPLLFIGVIASRSSATTPLETMTTPEGTVINSYAPQIHVADLYQVLLANGLQPWIGLARVDGVDGVKTMVSVGGGTSTAPDGTVTYFSLPSTMQINVNDWTAHPNFSIGHEYGHVWADYYRWTYWQGSWAAYLDARGLTGDPRLDSGGCWYIEEIIADDYRQLFAAPETTPGVIIARFNPDIPIASAVPGLREFLGMAWTNGHPPPGYAAAPTATPTARPTLAPIPTPTATRTPRPTKEHGRPK